jgi:hypothetical protein
MIQYTSPSRSPVILSCSKALRRAAKRALELGIRTNTPVYVMEKGRIVDIAKRHRQRAVSKKMA